MLSLSLWNAARTFHFALSRDSVLECRALSVFSSRGDLVAVGLAGTAALEGRGRGKAVFAGWKKVGCFCVFPFETVHSPEMNLLRYV